MFKLYTNKLDLEVKFKITNIDIRSDKPEKMTNHKRNLLLKQALNIKFFITIPNKHSVIKHLLYYIKFQDHMKRHNTYQLVL